MLYLIQNEDIFFKFFRRELNSKSKSTNVRLFQIIKKMKPILKLITIVFPSILLSSIGNFRFFNDTLIKSLF
jgi:hypothetical protein